MDMVKNGCDQSGHGAQKGIDGIKLFFLAGLNSGELKVDSVIGPPALAERVL